MLTHEVGFMTACKDFFDPNSDQTLIQYRDKMKCLNEADKKEITAGLTTLGYKIRQEP
jgi:hypothetical protein